MLLGHFLWFLSQQFSPIGSNVLEKHDNIWTTRTVEECTRATKTNCFKAYYFNFFFFLIAFIPMAIYKNLLVLEKRFQCSLSSAISSYREVAVEKALK